MPCDCNNKTGGIELKQYPANVGHADDPFSSGMVDLKGVNNDALYLSLTGGELTEDQTITEGHKHNDGSTRLTWRSLSPWPSFSDDDALSREGTLISSTSAVALSRFLIPFPMRGSSPVYKYLYTRIQASLPLTAVNSSVVLTASFLRYQAGTISTAITPNAAWELQISELNAAPAVKKWYNGPVIWFDPADLAACSGLVLMQISGSIGTAGHKASLISVQAGWR